MPPGTLWSLDDQTIGKHLVFKYYFSRWLQILGSRHRSLLLVDGFAGPGQYDDGEPGSPLIALNSIRDQKSSGKFRDVKVVCLFMEEKQDRARHLRFLVKRNAPPDTECHVLEGQFSIHMTRLLDLVDKQNSALQPAFVMIDPFGVKGISMELVARILANNRSECMISFMYEPIRRFHRQSEFVKPLDQLFGTTKWQRCREITENNEKKRFLHELFKSQLKDNGAKYVVYFELWNGNRHVYTIYFATGHEKGCNLMKEAIWKADPTGTYRLQGHTRQQNLLFESDMMEPLISQLKDRFGNRPTRIEDIDQYMMSDETIFHKGHLRKKTLQPLERASRVVVSRPRGGRGFPAGRGITIQFL